MNPTANKRKGATFELALLDHLRERGMMTERLRLAGKEDEGDLVVLGSGRAFVIEAKAEKEFRLAQYVKEMQVERTNFEARRSLWPFAGVHGLVVVKRPRAKIHESYVVKTLADELLLWEAL